MQLATWHPKLNFPQSRTTCSAPAVSAAHILLARSAGKMASDPMAYVKESLSGGASVADRLRCVGRLRVVALALGEDKTRNELLPFLTKLRGLPVRGRLALPKPPWAPPLPPE